MFSYHDAKFNEGCARYIEYRHLVQRCTPRSPPPILVIYNGHPRYVLFVLLSPHRQNFYQRNNERIRASEDLCQLGPF